MKSNFNRKFMFHYIMGATNPDLAIHGQEFFEVSIQGMLTERMIRNVENKLTNKFKCHCVVLNFQEVDFD